MRFDETDYSSPGQLDFVPRERRNQVNKLILVFVVALAALFIIGMLGAANRLHATLLSLIIVAFLGFYAVFRNQRNLDLVMATEFQNMLFAQGTALGAAFCIFVKRDGTIVYANDGLKELFPHAAYSDSRALEAIFAQGGVHRSDRERIMGAIYAHQAERIAFPARTASGEEKNFILTVEPLQRPGGFSLVRGREFRGQRAGVQLLPPALRATSADKLDALLAATPVAHYVTDAFGRIEYANPACEELLGYAPGEMMEGRLALRDMLYQISGQRIAEDYRPGEYYGDALLQKKQGGYANVILHQAVSRDHEGRTLGATGSILPHEAARLS
jgi:PAS domain S-box-containing protein